MDNVVLNLVISNAGNIPENIPIKTVNKIITAISGKLDLFRSIKYFPVKLLNAGRINSTMKTAANSAINVTTTDSIRY